jgi:hypothetical protein
MDCVFRSVKGAAQQGRRFNAVIDAQLAKERPSVLRVQMHGRPLQDLALLMPLISATLSVA